MARCGQTGDVRHLCPGDKPDACLLGQAEERLQPTPGDLFSDRARRAAGIDAGVLIPRRGEPIGRHRRGQSSADHPGKEAAAL